MLRVINIKDAPVGWRENPDYEYIGRGTLFGNPLKIGDYGPGWGRTDRDFVVEWYRKYAKERFRVDKEFRKAVMGLKGKILVCFCSPLRCHGDILAKLAGNK